MKQQFIIRQSVLPQGNLFDDGFDGLDVGQDDVDPQCEFDIAL